MARRKRDSEHANHERWLVSYADFITLLFAFFVVLFAVSQVDSKKLGRLAESVAEATQSGARGQGKLGGDSLMAGSGQPFVPVPSPVGIRSEGTGARGAGARQIRRALEQDLAGAIKAGRMTITRNEDGIVVRLHGAAGFGQADAQLRPTVLPDLTTLGHVLARFENAVRIEGHTDSLPIRNSAYRSNWELAAGRAVAVLDQLSRPGGLPQSRLSIAGYGSERPIADNATDDGRSQNRRVDIVVLTRRRSALPNAPP